MGSTGFVYLMKSRRRLKIGFSSNPRYRCTDIARTIQKPVKLLFALASCRPREFEKSLHTIFAKHHIEGEWFKDAEEIHEFFIGHFLNVPLKKLAEGDGFRTVGITLSETQIGALEDRAEAARMSVDDYVAHHCLERL